MISIKRIIRISHLLKKYRYLAGRNSMTIMRERPSGLYKPESTIHIQNQKVKTSWKYIQLKRYQMWVILS